VVVLFGKSNWERASNQKDVQENQGRKILLG